MQTKRFNLLVTENGYIVEEFIQDAEQETSRAYVFKTSQSIATFILTRWPQDTFTGKPKQKESKKTAELQIPSTLEDEGEDL